MVTNQIITRTLVIYSYTITNVSLSRDKSHNSPTASNMTLSERYDPRTSQGIRKTQKQVRYTSDIELTNTYQVILFSKQNKNLYKNQPHDSLKILRFQGQTQFTQYNVGTNYIIS